MSLALSASECPPTGFSSLTGSNTKPHAPYAKQGPGGIFSRVFTSYKRSTPLHPEFQVTDPYTEPYLLQPRRLAGAEGGNRP